MKHLHEIICEYRKSKGISQMHVSKQTGISNKKISAIETGRVKLGLEDFLIICDKGFNVNPSIFIKEFKKHNN